MGCSATDTVDIEAYEIYADFTISDSILHCSPQGAILNSINNEYIVDWNWLIEESVNTTEYTDTDSEYIHAFTDQGYSDLTLTIGSEHGCSDTITYVESVLLNNYTAEIAEVPDSICFNGATTTEQDFTSTITADFLDLPYDVIDYSWNIISSNSGSASQTTVDTFAVNYEFVESGAYTLVYSAWIDGTDSDCNYTDTVVFNVGVDASIEYNTTCLLYTSPSPRDQRGSRMPSSA